MFDMQIYYFDRVQMNLSFILKTNNAPSHSDIPSNRYISSFLWPPNGIRSNIKSSALSPSSLNPSRVWSNGDSMFASFQYPPWSFPYPPFPLIHRRRNLFSQSLGFLLPWIVIKASSISRIPFSSRNYWNFWLPLRNWIIWFMHCFLVFDFYSRFLMYVVFMSINYNEIYFYVSEQHCYFWEFFIQY